MLLNDAIKEMKSGSFWQYVDAMPEETRQNLCDAAEMAVLCMELAQRLYRQLQYEEKQGAESLKDSAGKTPCR